MLKSLRLKLTVAFTGIVLTLYIMGACFAFLLFQSSLGRSMDVFLLELLSEIRPSVQLVDTTPTLKVWAMSAKKEHSAVLATVQLFDLQGKLLERYGPPGIDKLEAHSGRLSNEDDSVSVRTASQSLIHEDQPIGHLQVQVSMVQNDEAIEEIIRASLLAAPLLACLAALTGYFFCRILLTPVEKTMLLLRRFVADAGHELRTPVAVIEACVETNDALDTGENFPRAELSMIRESAARMRFLTADLIYLARFENPTKAIRKDDVLLNALVLKIIAEYQVLARNKQIHIDLETTEEYIVVRAEEESIRQLISNLVSNAITYSDAGGHIRVVLSLSEDKASIAVTDTGMGIDEKDLQTIFERFYRTDESRSRTAGGAGLGLSIVKAVIEAHRGSISVTSKVGEGSTFCVTLPQA